MKRVGGEQTENAVTPTESIPKRPRFSSPLVLPLPAQETRPTSAAVAGVSLPLEIIFHLQAYNVTYFARWSVESPQVAWRRFRKHAPMHVILTQCRQLVNTNAMNVVTPASLDASMRNSHTLLSTSKIIRRPCIATNKSHAAWQDVMILVIPLPISLRGPDAFKSLHCEEPRTAYQVQCAGRFNHTQFDLTALVAILQGHEVDVVPELTPDEVLRLLLLCDYLNVQLDER